MVTVHYAHDADYENNHLLNARMQEVSGLPSATAGNAGWFLYNSLTGRAYYSTGVSWEWIATNSDALNGQNGAYYLARANHTGNQLASTISNFVATVLAQPINTLAAAIGPIDAGNQRIINGAPGSGLTDFATVGQVTDIANNLGFRLVRGASTANVSLATGNGSTMDGLTLLTNDLVLLKDQTTPAENGIYIVNATTKTRATSADTAAELPPGTIVVVAEGTANHDKMFMMTTDKGYVMGTDPIVFSAYGTAPNPYTAGNGIGIVGNVVSAVAGTGITVGVGGIAVDPAVVSRHFELDLPAPTSGTSITVTHSLNRRPVPLAVMESSSGDLVYCGVNYPDANNVILDFAIAPTASQYRLSIG
jgi:hypothetical protein